MRKCIFVAIGVLLACSLCACGKNDEAESSAVVVETTAATTEAASTEAQTEESTEAETTVQSTEGMRVEIKPAEETVISNSGVGTMNVFHEYLKVDGNRLYSPYSLKGALSILYPGVTGESKEQLDKVLGFSDDAVSALESYEDKINSADYGLKVANRVYINDSANVNTSSLRETDVESISVSSTENINAAVDSINSFVANATNNKIPQIVSTADVNPSTVLLALNALYFNKVWEFKDDEGVVGDAHVYWSNGTDTETYVGVGISDESATKWDKNIKTDDEYNVDITRLKYECNDDEPQFSLYLFSDKTDSDEYRVKEYMQSLDDAKLEEVTTFEDTSEDTESQYSEITITFPKFRFSSTEDISQMVSGAGLSEIFNVGTPDFDSISEDVYISKILQATYIDVNETGTEAAAATAVAMETAMAMPEKPSKWVCADSPFGYVIKDDTNDVILFVGYIDSLSDNVGEVYSSEEQTEVAE